MTPETHKLHVRQIELNDAKKRLIVALDVDSPDKAMDVVNSLTGEVGLFKVGMELFPRGGPELVRKIKEVGFDVFLDLKFKDIPNTVAGAIRSAVALGVKLCTVHADGGRKMLAAAAEAAQGSSLTILGVTVLTSLDDGDLDEIGFAFPVQAEVRRLAALAVSCGIGGLVSSAQETSALRADSKVGNSVKIVNAGIRLPEDAVGDQKRVVTPFDAFRNGADYIVVGRPITKDPDPATKARKFVAAIAEGLAARAASLGQK